MNLYLKQIKQLIQLQTIDNEIRELNKTVNDSPLQLSNLKERLDVQEKQRNDLKEKIVHLKEQKKKLSHEIEEDVAKIKKSKNKLMMVENSREYNAMMREMDNLEKNNRMREEEKSNLEEDLAVQSNMMQALDQEITRMQEKIESLDAQIRQDVEAAKARLVILREQRKEALADVPKPILSRYEFINSRLPNPVIVPVEDGICSGCNISIPPQTFIELQKAEQILSCPNCQRLIFWNEQLEDNNDEK